MDHWRYTKVGGQSRDWQVVSARGGFIAQTAQEKHARAIAALPYLLAALKAVASMHCRPNEPYRIYEDRIGAMPALYEALSKVGPL